MKINIDQVAKIEGHLGFMGHILEGDVAKARVEVHEGARLIEGILIGRRYDDAPLITSRICGVCPIVHNICSIKSMEDALNVEVSEGVKILRKVLLMSQMLQSHSLHLFFLVLPDYFKEDETIKLTKEMEKETEQALRIRAFSDKVAEVIGGRAIHLTNTKIGGFGRFPDRKELQELQEESRELLLEAVSLAEIFKNLSYPDFSRKTEFISITNSEEYDFYEGKINASDEEPIDVNMFLPKIKEMESPFDVVKRGQYKGDSYMVGSLARINNNKNDLKGEAKKLAEEFFKEDISYNTFHNIYSQMIEVVYCVESIDNLIEKFIKGGYLEEDIIAKEDFTPKEDCWGVGAVEAPRGTLFHIYNIGSDGNIKKSDVISPTAQFLQNLENDLKVFLPDLKNMDKQERERKIKMMVRAYDPCISCATH
jgi:coenzyme F420-reducing hydrogenase alpha subunit